jgi:pimeloyl-ACP methyl ester carboxylesterase
MRETGAVFGGVRSRVIEVEGSEPPLLLLHGYSDSADTWRPLLRELEDRDRRAVAVDMRGFGQAEELAEGLILPQLDEFVAAFVREHTPSNGRGNPVLVGNSLGGVAILRAAQNPELRIAGVVPISPAGLGHQPWVDVIEREPVIHRILTSPVPVPMRVVRQAVTIAYGRVAVGDRSRMDPSAAAAYASLYRSREDIVRTIRNARRILAELHDPYELAKIGCPVMAIWGDRDLLTPIRGSKHLLDAIPNAELIALEGVGHCAQVEVTGRIAELISDFGSRRAPVGRAARVRAASRR